MKKGWVTFAGAGPGAVDLLTVRCQRAIEEADVIIFAGSLVNPEILDLAAKECTCIDSAPLALPEIVEYMVTAVKKNLKVLRLHTGDPSLYGATAEQMRLLDKNKIPYETIPGITAICAAAASLNRELTLPGVSQTVIIGRQSGRTPVPENQELSALATHNVTLALYLSVSSIETVVNDLRTGGYNEDTPVAVVYRASWPEEIKLTGTLQTIAQKVRARNISRQALIIVGDALSGWGDNSLLYAPQFSHGYRQGSNNQVQDHNPLLTKPDTTFPEDTFFGNIAVYAITEVGVRTALRLAQKIKISLFLPSHFSSLVKTPLSANYFDAQTLGNVIAAHWNTFDGHVFFMASGIVVRKIAPLLQHKTIDPAVIVGDEKGEHTISLIGGHIAGANRLARTVGRIINGSAVITTATDSQKILAFDELAAQFGWTIHNPRHIKKLNRLLLEKGNIGFIGEKSLVEHYYSHRENVVHLKEFPPSNQSYDGFVWLNGTTASEKIPSSKPILYVSSNPLIVGLGCKKGTKAEDIETALRQTCQRAFLDSKNIKALASISLKKDEPGLTILAQKMGIPITFIPADKLNTVSTPTASSFVASVTGTLSVAEAAALFVSKGKLLVSKQKFKQVTVAIATENGRKSTPTKDSHNHNGQGKLRVVGIGSGALQTITPQAREAILEARVIVGYTKYCQQLASLTFGKEVVSMGMKSEIERCDIALERASLGQKVVMVGSGDAGIYGMVGLLYERLEAKKYDHITLEVIPGITAATLGAAVIGAPLMNDFAVLSLSDLLTDKEVIINRLQTLAQTDIMCVLYNPKSKKRIELFEFALTTFKDSRGDTIPAALVNHAGQDQQNCWVGLLKDLPRDRVTMATVVYLGSKQTAIIDGKMVTRRGYQKKSSFASSPKSLK